MSVGTKLRIDAYTRVLLPQSKLLLVLARAVVPPFCARGCSLEGKRSIRTCCGRQNRRTLVQSSGPFLATSASDETGFDSRQAQSFPLTMFRLLLGPTRLGYRGRGVKSILKMHAAIPHSPTLPVRGPVAEMPPEQLPAMFLVLTCP
jgi:hypothetical protein